MASQEFIANRAARRAKGYRKQVKAVRLDVPAERAAAKGVKHGDRFVIPQRRLNREGKLEVCQTGQETIFLANVVQPEVHQPRRSNQHEMLLGQDRRR